MFVIFHCLYLFLSWITIFAEGGIDYSVADQTAWSPIGLLKTGTPILTISTISFDKNNYKIFLGGGHYTGRIYFSNESLSKNISLKNSISWKLFPSNLKISSIYSCKPFETISGKSALLFADDHGSIFHGDGKNVYQVSSLPTTAYSVAVGRNNKIFVTGSWGALYSTTLDDQFVNWNIIPTFHTETIFDISTVDGINIIYGTNHGSIFWSNSSGDLWNVAKHAAPGRVFCVVHSSILTAFAAGDFSYVAKTVDGGITWTRLYVFDSNSETIRYNSISIVSELNLFIAGSSGTVYSSEDAGLSWTLIYSVGSTIYSLYGLDSSSLIISTVDAVIQLTSNSNHQHTLFMHNRNSDHMSLTEFTQPTSSPTGRIAYGEWNKRTFSSGTTIFIGAAWENEYKILMVGKDLTDGVMVSSNDSGTTWQRTRTINDKIFSDVVYFHDLNTNTSYFIASSDSESILSTVDFGLTWNQTSADGVAMNGVTVGRDRKSVV